MDGKLAATAAAALVAGAALGFVISRTLTEAPPPPAAAAADASAPAGKKPARALSAALPSDADILRRRIEDLEAQNKDLAKRLAAESAKAAKAQTPPATAGRLDSERIGIARAEQFEESLSRMKEEDPERYKRTVEARTRLIENKSNAIDRTLDFLNSFDLSKMPPQMQEVHNSLCSLIRKRTELEKKLASAGVLDKDERKSMTDTLAQTYAEVKALHDEERRNLKLCAAMETGLSLEEAARLIMTADAIDNATTDFPSTMRDPAYNRPRR